ncbi:MAG: 3-hydroxybutyryl-CoA dehydrogenase [Flavobacteriales bacterium]|nr:3-hydroxybutyryl-CoA dehydrogenase [Flavobacteriales bacterium]
MKIGVIGAGTMGSGIAQVAATFMHEVLVFDTNEKAIETSKAKLEKILNRLIEKERITAEDKAGIQSRINYITDLKGFSECGLVIEAIIEDLGIKKKVFSELERAVSEDCIIASNTSSLSIASLAAACENPERFIGIHFFNPVPLMKLVEIVPAIQTSEETKNKAIGIIDGWDKLTVIAKDTPGFIVNKVARPFYSEALRIYEEGIADIPTIDWAMKEIGGFRMGPFELMDFIGNDVNYTVTETVFNAFYNDPRYKPAFTQKRLSEARYLGRKTGRGYYSYMDQEERPSAIEDPVLGQQIVDRILALLIDEAAHTLQFGIASKEDIDTAMTKGVNYPKGLLSWADELGVDEVVKRLDALYEHYHEERYRCCGLLRTMSKEGKRFYAAAQMEQ